VAQTGKVAQLGHPDQIDPSSTLRKDIKHSLSVPMRTRNGVVGVITVQGLDAEGFGSEDRLVMETLAKSVAGAIANARAIQKTEELREDLSRMIVHDLRNPVQAVLYTLQEVQRAAEGHLPNKVTDSVRTGLMPASLNDHIRAAVRRFAPIARVARIQITTVLSQEVPVVRVDYELLDRTIANLVGNALKFTPEGASITIRSESIDEPREGCRFKAPCVMVSVQDTGEGIPEEFHDKIFEKYEQVETRKAGLKMSTGLGLALCRYVVNAHGGGIWVESKVGKGSTFRFTLPVKK
jgi:signal transduction histidine kinase